MAMGPKHKSDDEADSLERAPWEDGALTIDVTSVPADVVLKNCLSDDLPIRLVYIKGLAAAASRASRRELTKLLEALTTLLDDEALGVRLETLQQLQQLAKLAGSTAAPDEVEEAVVDALEQQIKASLEPGGGGGGGSRAAGGGTGALPMVREALLASLDAICTALGPGKSVQLLLRLQRAANAAQDKPGGVGPATAPSGGAAAAGGRTVAVAAGVAAGAASGSKVSGDAALMALSLAAVTVRHLDPDRGGLSAAAMAGRLAAHGDIRVREAVAGALPHLYDRYAAHPGAMDQCLTTYDTLCNDKVWTVRQACARVAAALSQLCSRCDGDPAAAAAATATGAGAAADRLYGDALQVWLLRSLFLDTLLLTKSQWVITAARQQAGAAIATLRPGVAAQLLPPLLEAYCGGAAAVGQGAVEVRRAAAESLADVVAVAGPERWQQQLQPVFHRLLASTDPDTLSALVASAERMVRLLAAGTPPAGGCSGGGGGEAAAAAGTATQGSGGEHEVKVAAVPLSRPMPPPAAAAAALHAAARQVVSGPLLEVLQSQLHVVAPAAAASLAGLLSVSPPDLQQELLQVLPQLCEPPPGATGRCGDWRSRLILAESLATASRAVAHPSAEAETTPHDAAASTAAAAAAAAVVARCAVRLCQDPVWAVRHAAAAKVGALLVALGGFPPPSWLLTPAPPQQLAALTLASGSAAESSEAGGGGAGDGQRNGGCGDGTDALTRGSNGAVVGSAKVDGDIRERRGQTGEDGPTGSAGGGGDGERPEAECSSTGRGEGPGRQEGSTVAAALSQTLVGSDRADGAVAGASGSGAAPGPGPGSGQGPGLRAESPGGGGRAGRRPALTELQRTWLERVSEEVPEGPTQGNEGDAVTTQVEGGEGGGVPGGFPDAVAGGGGGRKSADGGPAGRRCGAAARHTEAVQVLAAWLRSGLARGSVMEEQLLVACWEGAAAAAAAAAVTKLEGCAA